MAEWHVKSRRKPSGGLNRSTEARDKRKFELGGYPAHTKYDEKSENEERVTMRSLGGNVKVKARKALKVNVAVNGKVESHSIKNIDQNDANKQFVRQNVITKGAVVETDAGKVRITSRPGQDGVVNGVIIAE